MIGYERSVIIESRMCSFTYHLFCSHHSERADTLLDPKCVEHSTLVLRASVMLNSEM
jgi:hypothetical protein